MFSGIKKYFEKEKKEIDKSFHAIREDLENKKGYEEAEELS
jgi:hypothetical protein